MQYNGPYDQPFSPDASYANGNPAIGLPGSIPPAALFETLQREIVNFIADNGLTPSNADLHQVSRGLQNSKVLYGLDTGTANALVVALSPVPLALTPGMTIRVKKSAAANSGSVTLDVGLGPNYLLKADGNAFIAGELPANMLFQCTWDGQVWSTINFLGIQRTSETITNNYISSLPYTIDTSTIPNLIVAPFSPGISFLTAGDIIRVKLAQQFLGGAVTINVNDMAAINVKRGDGMNPMSSDGYPGQILLLAFDGTFLQIINSVAAKAALPLIVADQKPSSIAGGSFSAGAWRTRDLNTILSDPFDLVGQGLVSLANNRLTLGAGKWIISARAPFTSVLSNQIRLYNVTDASQAIKGTFHTQNLDTDCAAEVAFAFLDGMLTLTTTKTFELQHICASSQDRYGFGMIPGQVHQPIFGAEEVVWSTGNPGPETYSIINLWRA